MQDPRQIVSKQLQQWNQERASAGQEQNGESLRAGSCSVQKPVVTISRQRGCRSRELAKLLSRELHYGILFDRQVINYIAQDASVRQDMMNLLDENDRSRIEYWIEGHLPQYVETPDDYIRALAEVLKTTALQGGVVILGRGANYLLTEASTYRIRTVASKEYRIRNLVQVEGMSTERAESEINRVDSERSEFVKRYFKRNVNNPEDYDMVLNLEPHTLESAVKIILSALRSRGWPMDVTGGDKRTRR